MTAEAHTIVVGAGIVGVSTAIWLRRAGVQVTLLDRDAPGQGTSYGNAGVLANCSMVPVTVPGLIRKGPRYALDPNFPLFLRWSYLPKLLPWLLKYLAHANDADTRRIAHGLTPIVGDGADQHKALSAGTGAADWVVESDYTFAYATRAAFDADSYVWDLRREAGFEPEILEGEAARDYEPNLGPAVDCLAVMKDHGFIRDPGGYVMALAEEFQRLGGTFRKADVRDFSFADGKVRAVETTTGAIPCTDVVLATGVWSKPLMKRLGLTIPLESERGYHVVYEGATGGPAMPIMVAAGKFVATPMAAGLRCAGVVEFGGLEAGPSAAPFALLRREVAKAFPRLQAKAEVEWQGHRPAPADSLPLIGQVGGTGVYVGFGHHHIGLTGGPKTGRLLAQLMTGQKPNLDMAPYDPARFAS
ncbi:MULTISPECIES: NAD(P)/FAD-dependent oxidoreductase [Paracoccaceae]|jgi:D-amino-acid dehydrogenase|uniref:NAD(P)/FAD-dependent oxidoreductase n=1 Tax=Rhodobacterales TaxID=204455 RepID=UPI001B1ACBF1|nr:FAD-dependent oxidoreductase [Boseongicola sp. H5]MBO6603171.1 FAD-binding oxidoreductase [Roseicyclus sp.]MBO6623690.1 FAD-binding oxidoreductase [Roseicyclus sp.]MBO6922857.1 FAD-binding oxidoreductase [Roseicyclus sp.]